MTLGRMIEHDSLKGWKGEAAQASPGGFGSQFVP